MTKSKEINKATKEEIEKEVSEELTKKSEEINKKLEELEKKTEGTKPNKKQNFLANLAKVAGYLVTITALFGGVFGLNTYFTASLKEKVQALEVRQNQTRDEILYLSKLVEYMAFKNKLANIDPNKDNVERIIFSFTKSHEDFITCVNKMRKNNIAVINWYNEYITIHSNHYYFPPTVMRGMDKQIERKPITSTNKNMSTNPQAKISIIKDTPIKSIKKIDTKIKDGELLQ